MPSSTSPEPQHAKYTKKESRFSSHSLIAKMAGDGRGRVCLDVGCSTGYLAEILTRQGWTVDGIESDPVSSALASRACRRVFDQPVELWKPATANYDLIIFGDVLEHLVNPEQELVRFAQNHLSPGGQIIISLPNVAHVTVRLGLLLGRFEPATRGIMDSTHLHFFTRRGARKLISDSGLDISAVSATPVPVEEVLPFLKARPFAWLQSINAVASRALPTLLGYQFVFRCTVNRRSMNSGPN